MALSRAGSPECGEDLAQPRKASVSSVVFGALLALAALLAWLPAAAGGEPGVPRASSERGAALVQIDDLPPGSLVDDGGPSEVIFPPQRVSLAFDHRRHVQELRVTCIECHQNARSSRQSADSLLPSPTACDRCHATSHRDLERVTATGGDPKAACSLCHAGYQQSDGNRVARMVIPRPNLKFSHAAHAQRNIGCARCHGAVENVGLATRQQLPRMRGCLECHHMPGEARGDAAAACETCHLSEAGRLKTHFASGELLPPRWLRNADHGPDWIERHKVVAGNDSGFCGSCHEESECVACHDGRVRPRQFHPSDWLNLHATVSDQGASRCGSCHGGQSFCLPCHQRAGITLTGSTENIRARGRFHPPKALWMEGSAMASQHHGYQARRNLSACVSCHTERDCVICHGATGSGSHGASSPHPPGFAATCGRALRQNARPCFVCHDAAGPELGRCR